jgi:hypothetical protein
MLPNAPSLSPSTICNRIHLTHLTSLFPKNLPPRKLTRHHLIQHLLPRKEHNKENHKPFPEEARDCSSTVFVLAYFASGGDDLLSVWYGVSELEGWFTKEWNGERGEVKWVKMEDEERSEGVR